MVRDLYFHLAVIKLRDSFSSIFDIIKYVAIAAETTTASRSISYQIAPLPLGRVDITLISPLHKANITAEAAMVLTNTRPKPSSSDPPNRFLK